MTKKKSQYIHLFFQLIGVLVSIGHGNFVKLFCMRTRTQGLGTRTDTGYMYRVVGYDNGMYPDVPSCTMNSVAVPGTSYKKIGYVW